MGEVYRATDTTLGRQVAIKVLPEAFAQEAAIREACASAPTRMATLQTIDPRSQNQPRTQISIVLEIRS